MNENLWGIIMRRGISVQAVVFAGFCCVVLFGVSQGQVVLADDQDVSFRDGDPSMSGWTSLADMMPVDGTQNRTSEPEAARAAWVVDDFEDGNIDGWIDEGSGACYAGTSAVAASGAYSMRVDGACGHMRGRVFDITGSMPTGISFSVRADTVNTYVTYFILGDSNSGVGGNSGAIDFHGRPDGTWVVFNGTGYSCGNRNAAQWYTVGLNVDWACKMYDVSIDGVPKASNVPFYYTATEAFDRIHVYNYDSATGRYDDIYFYTPGVNPLIFEDDFERGSICRWSGVGQ